MTTSRAPRGSRRGRFGGARLSAVWEHLRTSFWFVPALMTAGAVGLSFVAVYLDELATDRWLREVEWIWAGSPEGAREVLSTIAGSMMTVAGVVFSITIVALALASNQFGPRLLRNFVRDTVNQVVLGTFIATFVYCLLVLRTVRSADDAEFVPAISVTLGMVLALASLGVLIYFIHHIATAIQADELIAAVAVDLRAAIDDMFPETLGEPAPARPEPEYGDAAASAASVGANGGSARAPGVDHPGAAGGPPGPPDFPAAEALAVAARRSGYLQGVDGDALLEVASERDLLLRLECKPGAFIGEKATLLHAFPRERLDDDTVERLRSAFVQGRRRTPTQDPEYAVDQLVEVAVRALSPSLNDPFTAITCLDWLGAALSDLACRRIPSRFRSDDQGRLRVISPRTDFDSMADAAFDQIRQYGRGSVAVILRLLDTFAVVGRVATRPGDRACLREHADKTARDASEALPNELDRQEVEARHRAVLEILR